MSTSSTAPPASDSVGAPPQAGARPPQARPARTWLRPLLAVPLAVLLLVVFLYPTLSLLGQTFTDFRPPQEGGLDNLRWFFDTPTNVRLLFRTLWTCLLVTGMCLALGYAYAYMMTRVGRRVRMVMFGALLLPYLSSLMMRNFAWIVILGRNGVLNSVLEGVGLPPVQLLGTTTGMLIGMAHIQMPLMTVPLYAILRGIDYRYVLAAQSLGARPHRAFLRVYVPMSMPGVITGSLLTFVMTIGVFVTPVLLGSPSNAVLSQLIAQQSRDFLAWGRTGAMSIVAVASVVVLLIAMRALLRSPAYGTAARPPDPDTRGGTRWRIAQIVIAGGIGAWLVAPTLVTIPMSFTSVTSFLFPPPGWSTRWYANFFDDVSWYGSLINSLQVGVIVTVLATVLGTAAALGVMGVRSRWRGAVLATFLLPLIVPIIVVASALYAVFLEWGMIGQFQGVTLAHLTLFAPLVLFTVFAALQRFDTELERAAASLGASPWATFRQVTLPLLAPAVIGGALLAFLQSMDETVVSQFLISPSTRTLPVKVYDSVIHDIDPTVGAVAAMNLVITALALGVAALVIVRRRRAQGAKEDDSASMV